MKLLLLKFLMILGIGNVYTDAFNSFVKHVPRSASAEGAQGSHGSGHCGNTHGGSGNTRV